LPVSHAALMMLCFELCPSELGTRGAADLPRSTAKLRDAADHRIAKKCDMDIKLRSGMVSEECVDEKQRAVALR